MADYETFFPGRFLRGFQIPADAPTTIQILEVKGELLPGEDKDEQRMIVLAKMRDPVSGTVGPKEIVWCKTNCMLTAEGYGRETDGWVGKVVYIHNRPDVKRGKDVTGGVRVWGFPSAVWPQDRMIEIKRPRRKVPEKYLLRSVSPPKKESPDAAHQPPAG